MELFRFMSNEEFKKLKKGEILYNDTIHIGRTNSVGFCFLNLDEYKPEDAIHFLSGIVNAEVCVKIKTKEKFKKSYGIYAKPLNKASVIDVDFFFDLLIGLPKVERMKVIEYTCKNYSLNNVEIISYAKPIWGENNWDWKLIN